MQVPIGRIKRHVDMADYSGCLVDLGEKHQAIGAAALDPAHVVVRRSQPGFSLGNHAPALAHTAVSGVGILGKPPKWMALLKTLVQVESVRSHPGSSRNWSPGNTGERNASFT